MVREKVLHEISYSIGECENGDIYHYIDTDDESVVADAVSNWFKQVQFPQNIELEELHVRKVSNKK